MAGRKAEPLDLNLKDLKLELIDLVSPYIEVSKHYIQYLAVYEDELKALSELSEAEQSKGLRNIASKVIASYKWSRSGDRKHG